MYTQTSSCPQCGAPIYVPQMWHSVMPPPPYYSCNCNRVETVQTSTTFWPPRPDKTMTWAGFPSGGDPGPIKKTGATGHDAIEELAGAFEDDGVLTEENKLNTDDRLDNIEDHLHDLTNIMTKLAMDMQELAGNTPPVAPPARKKATRKRIGAVKKVLLKD